MHSPRYNPLRRGSVLPLGVEAHLKIKVTPDLYTSPLPSYPRLVHTEPRHRPGHSELASDVCCAFPSQIEPTWQEKMPIRQQARKHRPHALHLSTTSCQDSCYTRVFHTTVLVRAGG